MPKYNYSKLRGLIKEHFGNLEDYAHYIGISSTSLNERLNSRLPFKQNEMDRSIKAFKVSSKEIDTIFFCKVNTETKL